MEFLKYLKQDPMPALDTETRSDGSLLGVSFAWAQDGEVTGVFIRDDELDELEWHNFWLELKGISFCGHNAPFDYNVLKNVNVEVQFGFDSYIASLWAWPPYSRDHSLKSLSVEELGVLPWGSAKELIEEYGSMEAVPQEVLTDYAVFDAVYTYRLTHEILKPKIVMMKASMAMNIECALIPVTWELNRAGVQVDLAEIATIRKQLQMDLYSLQTEINSLAGQSVFISSPAALSSVLFDVMKIDPGSTERTKTGFYSTSAYYLEQIQNNHPILPKVILYRQLTKLLTTYISSIESSIQPDGRIYSRFNPLGSVTGRFSSVNPNLHNLPIRSERGKEIRKIIVAKPGYKLVDVDYNQFQLRILADMSGSVRMKQIYLKGGDIHTETAKIIFRTLVPSKDERSAAKAINFGLIFGMGPGGIMEYGYSWDEAVEFYDRYFHTYDGVKEYLSKQHRLAWRGWVSTRYGRPCWVPRLHQDDSRAFISSVERLADNYPIQGTEGDMIKIAMIRASKMINENGYDAKIIMQVHDELVFEVEASQVDRFWVDIKERMETIPFSVPLVADITIGNNWLECKE